MGIWDSILGAALGQGSSLAITGAISGGVGMALGTGFGAYLHSLKAHCDREKLILTLGHIPKKNADTINENCQSIIETLLQQLDSLDDDCELKLQLGSSIRGHLETFCYLQPREGTDIFQIQKLHEGIKTMEHNSDAPALAIEKTIDEYFETYLNVNRKTINSENRAVAVATVQMMRNTSIILIQLMKALAGLPGQENEKRLEKFKAIINDYFTNILHNKLLAANFNKNLHEYLISTTTQREILASKIQDHYMRLLDQLIVEQRKISIQQLAQQSSIQLYGMTSTFLELIARLFDNQAGKEFTDITSYKIAQGILRADTGQATGMLPFAEKGIHALLKPLATIAENMSQLGHQEDLLSFVRYQDVFTDPESAALLMTWNQKGSYKTLTSEEQTQIAQDILAICKLLFICQALEKEFLQSATRYGHQGLLERGEYHAKRTLISVLYDEAMRRIGSFFASHESLSDILQWINDPKWLESQDIPLTGIGQSFLLRTETPDPKHLIKQQRFVTNSIFRRCILALHHLRARMDYAQDCFLNQHYLTNGDQVDRKNVLSGKENHIYLYNMIKILREFGLIDCLGLDLKTMKTPPHCINEDLFDALRTTHYKMQTADDKVNTLSGRLKIQAFYSPSKLSEGQIINYHLVFDDLSVEMDSTTYEFLGSIAFENCGWSDVVQSKWRQLGIKEQALRFNLPENCQLNDYLYFFQQLNQLHHVMINALKAKNNDAANAFLRQLDDAIIMMGELIEHVNLEEENTKKLAANNIRLKSEYRHQQQQLVSLSRDVNQLTTHLEQARKSIASLKESTSKNLEHISEVEQANDEIYQLLLNEFRENIQDINELNSTLSNKLDHIQSVLLSNQSRQVQEVSNDIQRLKQDMRTRIDMILQRFAKYEQSFQKANEDIRKTFITLKESISQEKSIIENLEKQLNEALLQLERQRQKNQFFVPKQGQVRVIINDFQTLFTHLEETFKPRLNFFSSYRDVKTKNLLTFIELLLANQCFLKDNFKSYRNQRGFDDAIEELLQNSVVINCYHGLFNNSVSKATIKSIITLFLNDQLLLRLKKEGIPYHDARIKLNFNGELVYKQERVPCPVQQP
ncbi:coiled-coil domain-containing protein [Legionella spiritensis]|uniref:Chromosome partition protein Smc n=1 Tax=Legionella spiritensis TaxID=452 RepID=A0A0W0Z086_LEGSP|nr:hypothetical protein [Legionella spiritensis]KTD62538.1 Chromosome partition protein Smc [Legionella spiritensis]SNV30750.1 Uncharacterised protein [Legionella spiritensis]